MIKELVNEYLPAVVGSRGDDPEANLGKWQTQVLSTDAPIDPTQALFAKWAEEDVRLTEQERAENERMYAEIEKNGIPRVQS